MAALAAADAPSAAKIAQVNLWLVFKIISLPDNSLKRESNTSPWRRNRRSNQIARQAIAIAVKSFGHPFGLF
jgi:hypothetical protein